MPKSYKSLSGYVRKIKSLSDNSGGALLFRGHSDTSYKLFPSLLRQAKLEKHERDLIMGLIAESPSEFSSDLLAFEKLVRAQHYGIPTRLLDITTNPLMGLYFACLGREKTRGQVRVLEVPHSHIKFFDSDSVSCKANLAFLKFEERKDLKAKISIFARDVFGTLGPGWAKFKHDSPEKWSDFVERFNSLETTKRLVQFIKQEKPYFENRIDPMDLLRSDVVIPKKSNARIAAQSGRFIVYGLTPSPSKDNNAQTSRQLRLMRNTILDETKLDIDYSSKEDILTELAAIGVNERTVFPELDRIAKSILKEYR